MTKPDLAGLIDAAGPPGPLSPRTLLGAPNVAGPLAPGALGEAAQALRDPRARITLRIWGDEATSAESTVLFPSDPAAGGGFLLNDIDGGLEVSGPVDAEQILALVAPLIPPTPPREPFVVQLEPPTMAALAAVVDMARDDVRQRRIAHALDGSPLPESVLADVAPFTPPRLAAYLDAWWAVSRFDQLLTYVVALGGRPKPPGQSAVAAALMQLHEAHLLAIDSALHVTPTKRLAPLIAAALGLSAGFQWQRVTSLEDGALALVERIVLPCAGERILDLSVTAAGLLRLAFVSRDEIAAFLIGELVGPDASPSQTTRRELKQQPTAGAAQTAALKPQPAGPPALSARRFCHQCGKPAAADDRFCGDCGTQLV